MTADSVDGNGGFEILEGPGFAARAAAIAGSLERWDDLRIGLDFWMHRRPAQVPFCQQIDDDRWYVRVVDAPLVYLLYEIDFEDRTVTYLSIAVVDAFDQLDTAFSVPT